MSNPEERLGRYRVRAAVAAALGASLMVTGMMAVAAEPPADEEEEELDEVQVTGSRITRRDLQSNSPLVTIERQQLEDSTFISVEEALNDLPQFMVGGAGMSAAAVTTLQGANGVDGGRGTGDAFNMSLLPDNAGMIGIVVPGAANVNLRGLGANRSLTLIDGHRAMPINASMTVDLNTIPTAAIGGMEVITGGASAVYGADALAGVTNIKLRQNFEGMSLRVRGGINEVGDGEEYQMSGLMGTRLAGKGYAMIGIEYSKRNEALWRNRSFFREVMESPYSSSGDYGFSWEPFYSPGAATGSFNALQRAWSGNGPTIGAVNSVFSDRDCYAPGGTTPLDCIATATSPTASAALVGPPPIGAAGFAGYHFNADGTLFVRNSTATVGGVTTWFGPQGYTNPALANRDSPGEIVCTWTPTVGVAQYGDFDGENCVPNAAGRIDYGRWLSSPREAYTLFGSASYEVNDSITAFANLQFAASDTHTRREPAPFQGGFGAVIPFGSTLSGFGTVDGSAIYLPSVVQVAGSGQVVGDTRAEYLPGGTRGTTCAPTGGCTMAQAFPVPEQLRELLESRPVSNLAATGTNPFRGLSACQDYTLALNPGAPGAQVNPTGGANYLVTMDPNTGQPVSRCGPNSGWQVNQQLSYLPPRGTSNPGRLYQFSTGLRGDLGLSDWTWELYASHGDSTTHTEYVGFSSLNTYQKIVSAPNYGQGYIEAGPSSKFLTCTSGLNPFDPTLVVSQDCIDAILSNQVDRNSMSQRIYEANLQGHAFDLPAGEVRASVGTSYRKNAYQFTPDSLRERDYVTDTSAGQFATGSIDEAVTAKEIYGELLVPLVRDLPFARSVELELGARSSRYSTGQTVETYKALASWEPLAWLRARGGYNRAERAPNMSELFATPSGSAQFASAPTDPCRTSNLSAFNVPTTTSNNAANTTTRAQLQELCRQHIDAWGGNGASDFHGNETTWDVLGGAALIVGNEGLANEKADTWTVGLAFSSPFAHPLLSRMSGTLDWYEVSVANPIEVAQTATIVNTCFNVNGLNPGYTLDDPDGFCGLIERDPTTGGIVRVYNSFVNEGKLVIRGLDVTMRWSGALTDMGFGNAPGNLSLTVNGNYLVDQIQRYVGSSDVTADYADYGGASRIRTSTALGYNWGAGHRVSLNWQYRLGTKTPTTFAAATTANNTTTSPTLIRNTQMSGYATTNLFGLVAGTQMGEVNASFSINNLLNTKPKPGGFDYRDPRQGFGSFSPFDDLVGRRYSVTLSMDF